MSEAVPGGKHWLWSCRLNRCLGGDPTEPLCSRAHRSDWRLFCECMSVLFRDPVHTEDVHRRWSDRSR